MISKNDFIDYGYYDFTVVGMEIRETESTHRSYIQITLETDDGKRIFDNIAGAYSVIPPIMKKCVVYSIPVDKTISDVDLLQGIGNRVRGRVRKQSYKDFGMPVISVHWYWIVDNVEKLNEDDPNGSNR